MTFTNDASLNWEQDLKSDRRALINMYNAEKYLQNDVYFSFFFFFCHRDTLISFIPMKSIGDIGELEQRVLEATPSGPKQVYDENRAKEDRGRRSS